MATNSSNRAKERARNQRWRSLVGSKGTVRILRKGIDFTCRPNSFHIWLRQWAKRYKILLNVWQQEDGNILVYNQGPKTRKRPRLQSGYNTKLLMKVLVKARGK